jgi:hypothetical protein
MYELDMLESRTSENEWDRDGEEWKKLDEVWICKRVKTQ